MTTSLITTNEPEIIGERNGLSLYKELAFPVDNLEQAS